MPAREAFHEKPSALPALGLAAVLAIVSPAALVPAAESAASFYVVKNRTSDGASTRFTDPNLVNGWGLAAGPTTPWWLANNGTDTSTLYLAGGFRLPLVVNVPGGPTGIVYNGGPGFLLHRGRRSTPAVFLYATLHGTILGWSTQNLTKAVVVVDNSSAGSAYTGLAIASSPDGGRLYAANFAAGRVDCFDDEFHPEESGCEFVDPTLPTGYAPFGIQNIGGQIYVAYALRDATTGTEIPGPGLGYVSAFDAEGTLLSRIASQGDLNAPWGLAMAPATGFGRFSGHPLVGNFGDGRVIAYQGAAPHASRGPLRNRARRAIVIDGLWGIAFGNGAQAGPADVLYFAAGPEGETHGLFGSIKAGRAIN